MTDGCWDPLFAGAEADISVVDSACAVSFCGGDFDLVISQQRQFFVLHLSVPTTTNTSTATAICHTIAGLHGDKSLLRPRLFCVRGASNYFVEESTSQQPCPSRTGRSCLIFCCFIRRINFDGRISTVAPVPTTVIVSIGELAIPSAVLLAATPTSASTVLSREHT